MPTNERINVISTFILLIFADCIPETGRIGVVRKKNEFLLVPSLQPGKEDWIMLG